MIPFVRRAAAGVAALAGLAGTAGAFYFPGWPGSGVANPPSLIRSDAPPWANPPSGRTFAEAVPPAFHRAADTPPAVPEPATVVLAGLAVAAVVARRTLPCLASPAG
jgi:hypothetical protein